MDEFQQILEFIKASYFLKILKESFWVIFFVVWLGSISFVIKDGKRRYSKQTFQNLVILLPLCLHLAGLLIYFLIRPSKTKSEKIYEQQLLRLGEELNTCPFCGAEIKDNFIFCPSCGKEIFSHCKNCAKPVNKAWQYCPYCRNKLKE